MRCGVVPGRGVFPLWQDWGYALGVHQEASVAPFYSAKGFFPKGLYRSF
jgi:hypothetical protein